MNIDELFAGAPKTEVKKKKKPARAKKKAPSFAEQRAGGKDPKHGFTLWYDRDEETRKKDSAHEVAYIMHKIKTSVNFRKHHRRKSTSCAQVRRGTSTKVCNDCGVLRGMSFFDKLKDPKKSPNLRRPYCLMCRRRRNKKAYLRRKNAIKP